MEGSWHMVDDFNDSVASTQSSRTSKVPAIGHPSGRRWNKVMGKGRALSPSYSSKQTHAGQVKSSTVYDSLAKRSRRGKQRMSDMIPCREEGDYCIVGATMDTE
eukprot:Sspe_Gene.56468::Locus_31065_Transcript_1_1_Confidence_1.000_Length_649::g.56468::m.56468